MPSLPTPQAPPPAPRLVVDIGNTRIKWGLCDPTAVVQTVALPPDDSSAWQQQLSGWRLTAPLAWAVSGVHPQRLTRFTDWLRARGDSFRMVISPRQLPLEVALARPDQVGVDRLLNAVAVNTRRRPNTPAVIVDAGSAVTVDYLDQHGVFCGGAILPGLRLMARALHEHTALLPLIDVDANVSMPATSTSEAMSVGIFAAVVGGIRELLERMVQKPPIKEGPQIFMSGGDAELLAGRLPHTPCVWPSMTLEGLRLVAWTPEST